MTPTRFNPWFSRIDNFRYIIVILDYHFLRLQCGFLYQNIRSSYSFSFRLIFLFIESLFFLVDETTNHSGARDGGQTPARGVQPLTSTVVKRPRVDHESASEHGTDEGESEHEYES